MMTLVAALESVMRAVLGEPVPMRERVIVRDPGPRSSEFYRLLEEHDLLDFPPGLVPCPACGTDQAPHDGRMAVHFSTREATRPCAGSWPAKAVAR